MVPPESFEILILGNAISSVLRGQFLSKMFAKSIVIFMLIYVCGSSSTSAGSYVIFRFSIFLVSVKSILCSCISIIRIHTKCQNRCQNWDFSSDGILVGIRDFQAKTGKYRRHRDGWTVCFTHTKKCPVQCRVKKRPDISSKYFKTNQNAKLCFCACLKFGLFLADILHLTQKAAKCTTCKHLFGKS